MKYIKWIAALALTATSLTTIAADIPATTIMDNYIGAGYTSNENNDNNDVFGNMHQYDIDKMEVSRTGTQLTVNIFTSFYNNIGQNGILLGDLFMAAGDSNVWNPNGSTPNSSDRFSNTGLNNTGTNWQYAVDLGSQGDHKNYSGTGWLRDNIDRNDIKDSDEFHNSGSRQHQAIMMRNGTGSNADYVRDVAWAMGGKAYKKGGVNYGALSFTIDVTGTALETANQIAFRWAMSCANDIIEGLASATPSGGGGGNTVVPEPQTILLMLLGMAGIAYRRKVS